MHPQEVEYRKPSLLPFGFGRYAYFIAVRLFRHRKNYRQASFFTQKKRSQTPIMVELSRLLFPAARLLTLTRFPKDGLISKVSLRTQCGFSPLQTSRPPYTQSVGQYFQVAHFPLKKYWVEVGISTPSPRTATQACFHAHSRTAAKFLLTWQVSSNFTNKPLHCCV